MSIKRISQVSFIIVILVIVLALFINFSLIVNVEEFLDQNNELENALTIEKTRLISQYDIIETLSILNSDSVLYDQAYETSLLHVETMKSIINQSQALFVDMNQYSLNRHDRYINQIQPIFLNIEGQLNDLSTPFSDQPLQSKLDIVSQLEQSIVSYVSLNSDLQMLIANDIRYLINGIFLLLVVFIFLFLFTISGFVSTQLPYIQKSLAALGNHHYDQQITNIKPFFTEEKNIHNEISDLFDENRFIEEVRKEMQNIYSMEDALDLMFVKIRDRIEIDRLGVAFVDYKREKFIAEYSVMNNHDIFLGPGFEVDIKDSSLKNILKHKQPVIIDDIAKRFQHKPTSPALALLSKENIQSNFTIPLITNSIVFGFLFFSSRKTAFFTDEATSFLEKMIVEINSLINRAYFSKIIFSKITESFAQLVESKDNDTGDHIDRMVNYSIALAKKVQSKQRKQGYEIDDKLILEIGRQASSHDIGKVGIPDAILKKDGPLDDKEWTIMKKHPEIGANIFKGLRNDLKIFDENFYMVAQDITMYHHEKWDGSGYPNGLSGFDIPLSARIVAIADVFDAISSKRVYKEAFDLETSFDIIKKGKGTHFDPYLVDCFIEAKETIISIYKTSYNLT